MKICKKCNIDKELDEFYKNKKSKDGYNHSCKECDGEYWRKPKEILDIGYKRCSKCSEVKKLENFSKKNTRKSGISSTCKECDREYRQRTYENFKIYRKTWLEKNRDSVRLVSREYEKRNYEKRKKQKLNYKNRNKHIFAWRSMLRTTLRRMGTKKESNTIELLGYNPLELKLHLENLFTIGMSWDNYGEWQIDHKIPVSFCCLFFRKFAATMVNI